MCFPECLVNSFSYLAFSAAVGIVSRSPGRQNALDPVSSLSAFPLPYRPQSAAHHSSPPTEYSSPIIPLTSQDARSYYSSSFRASPGRLFGFDDDSHGPPGSASLLDSQISGSNNIDTGYHTSRDWQTRDTKWPQSRSQGRRKYIPKGRRYDSPGNQRRLGPGHSNIHPPKKPPLFSAEGSGKRAQNGHKKKLPGPLDDDDTQKISHQIPQRPRLVRCPLSSDPLDEEAFVPSTVDSTCVSQYISSGHIDNSVQSIKQSKYWAQMEDDPIFSDLSNQSKIISIEELVKRRNQMLQNHFQIPRQAIMKEQGTQTDIESSAFLHPDCSLKTTAGKDGIILDSTKIKREPTTPPPLPPPFQHQQSPKESPHGKQKNRHYRTASLTDPDTPRSHAQQPARVHGLKRSRSDTEDDYKRESYHRRKRSDLDTTPLSPPSGFSRRARTSFYR
jgi:hypothetical protein